MPVGLEMAARFFLQGSLCRAGRCGRVATGCSIRGLPPRLRNWIFVVSALVGSSGRWAVGLSWLVVARVATVAVGGTSRLMHLPVQEAEGLDIPPVRLPFSALGEHTWNLRFVGGAVFPCVAIFIFSLVLRKASPACHLLFSARKRLPRC